MAKVKEISVADARANLSEAKAVFLDIRDPQSYEAGHVEGAFNLNDGNVESFLKSADKDKALIVYCYHGISSRGAAAFFQDQGFADVYSMSGGFEAWRTR